MRTVEWVEGGVRLIDQRILPERLETPLYRDYHAVGRAITDMVVRGAPAIGVTAAFGLALAGFQCASSEPAAWQREVQAAANELRQARPTAVNLGWALDRMLKTLAATSGHPVAEARQTLLAEAQAMAEEDIAINRRLGQLGAALIEDGDTIIHHCNTGALAAVDFGTALGVIFTAHAQGKRLHVLVDETRPRLQGARLTAWELKQAGISFDLITDNAAGHFLSTGQVQLCLVGADRIAANGDVANKIGTYPLAVVAHENGVPFYSVAPLSTIDLALPNGAGIPIEERTADEVLGLQIAGAPVAPAGSTARNPAFDVTPHRYLTGIVTEKGVARPPYQHSLARAVNG
jgi:methylthioribose-1-phosphate isomerase